jgi:hypothetical protein
MRNHISAVTEPEWSDRLDVKRHAAEPTTTAETEVAVHRDADHKGGWVGDLTRQFTGIVLLRSRR